MKTRSILSTLAISGFAALFIAALSTSPAAAQELVVAEPAAGEVVLALIDSPEEPPEIRIMNRIIKRALAQVEAPEAPESMTSEPGDAVSAWSYTIQEMNRRLVTTPRPPISISVGTQSSKVTGFYMNGYGYLFTIRWSTGGTYGMRLAQTVSGLQVDLLQSDLVGGLQEQNRQLERLLTQRNRRERETAEEAEEARAKAEEEAKKVEELNQEQEEISRKIEAWREEYADRIVEELKKVLATYGHTLHRAATDESITFILEQGDDDSENITLTVERGQLGGPGNIDRSLQAIKVSRGSTEANPELKSQIGIMAEIIDAAFDEDEVSANVFEGYSRGIYYGGEARIQYLPGYGVIFRKNARFSALNIVRRERVVPDEEPARAERLYTEAVGLDVLSEESREKIALHLKELRKKTAEIMAIYGSTMTELNDSEWIGINYDIGSTAEFLQSGTNNYLVLARMSDIREAARQSDGAEWLLSRLVTNEKTEK